MMQNLEFIVCIQIKQYDSQNSISDSCKYLKNNISIQELLENKFNVKIFPNTSVQPPTIVGFKKSVYLAGKLYNELATPKEILLD